MNLLVHNVAPLRTTLDFKASHMCTYIPWRANVPRHFARHGSGASVSVAFGCARLNPTLSFRVPASSRTSDTVVTLLTFGSCCP